MFQKCLVKSHKEISKDLSWALDKNIESNYDCDWEWNFSSDGRMLCQSEGKEVYKALNDYYGQFGEIYRVIPSYNTVVIIFKEVVERM